MGNFFIRPARLSDLWAIVAVENRCFTDDAWPAEDLEKCLKKSVEDSSMPMLVAYTEESSADGPGTHRDENVAGYCLGRMPGEHQGRIVSLAVTESYRGRHIGRNLLERVCGSLHNEGAHEISLAVRANNAGAIHLYELEGFVKSLSSPVKDNDGQEEIEMIRHFEQVDHKWNTPPFTCPS